MSCFGALCLVWIHSFWHLSPVIWVRWGHYLHLSRSTICPKTGYCAICHATNFVFSATIQSVTEVSKVTWGGADESVVCTVIWQHTVTADRGECHSSSLLCQYHEWFRMVTERHPREMMIVDQCGLCTTSRTFSSCPTSFFGAFPAHSFHDGHAVTHTASNPQKEALQSLMLIMQPLSKTWLCISLHKDNKTSLPTVDQALTSQPSREVLITELWPVHGLWCCMIWFA